MIEPHMIENYIYYVFVFEFNHVGFMAVITLLPGFLNYINMFDQ